MPETKNLQEESVVDVLHSEMGYDLPVAYAVGISLEHGNHDLRAPELRNQLPENIELVKHALLDLASAALDEYHEIKGKQMSGELPS